MPTTCLHLAYIRDVRPSSPGSLGHHSERVLERRTRFPSARNLGSTALPG